jgi:hypothetical protein
MNFPDSILLYHVKRNLKSVRALIDYALAMGNSYKPSQPHLTFENLRKMLRSAENDHEEVVKALSRYNIDPEIREAELAQGRRLATKLVEQFINTNPPPDQLREILHINDIIQGTWNEDGNDRDDDGEGDAGYDIDEDY